MGTLAVIEAREGLQVEGEVMPQLEGVTISVLDESSGQVMTTVSTRSDGKYTAGPLYDDTSYKLFAHKDGYNFKHTGDGVFRAIELSSIKIRVIDQDSDKPLQGVLLSLSGDQYRNHNATDTTGTWNFADLFAGSYHLRPLLKEYVFDPSPLNIEVKEGETTTFTLKATRVSYSCFGSVRSLNGAAEKHVVVEALGQEGEQEQTIADANGKFRLRGLTPGHKYTVRVVKGGEGEAVIERAAPASETFTMVAADHHGLMFVIFRAMTRFELSGLVQTSDEEVDSLIVQLAHADKQHEVFKSCAVPLSRYFEFSDLAEGEYTVSLHSTRIKKDRHKWDVVATSSSVSLGLGASKPAKPLQLSFQSSRRVVNEDIQSSSFGTFVLLAVVVFLMVNRELSLQLAAWVVERSQSATPEGVVGHHRRSNSKGDSSGGGMRKSNSKGDLKSNSKKNRTSNSSQ